jgi:hypothetical protein
VSRFQDRTPFSGRTVPEFSYPEKKLVLLYQNKPNKIHLLVNFRHPYEFFLVKPKLSEKATEIINKPNFPHVK